MTHVFKPVVGVIALFLSLMFIATVTSQTKAQAACTPAPKPRATINAHATRAARAEHLTSTQLGNVRTIVSIVLKKKLPKRAAVIAVATSMQESRLRDLPYGDRDSLG